MYATEQSEHTFYTIINLVRRCCTPVA